MNKDSVRGGIAAIALCVGVVVATVVTTISETGNFPLEQKKAQVSTTSPSASPSK
jgi:hypothetical protein